jgi:hypothetical protein
VSLQSQYLIMTGLGIKGDVPPHALQSSLVDGVHLRWFFEKSRGFPWHGYYLFRRPHQDDRPPYPHEAPCDPQFSELNEIPLGKLGTNLLRTKNGLLISDQELVLTSLPSLPNGLDLSRRKYLQFRLDDDEIACKANITVGSLGAKEIKVRVISFGKTVIEQSFDIDPQQPATVMYDSITAIEFSGCDAVISDICTTPVRWALKGGGWEALRDLSYPLCLPVSHEDYPCAGKPSSIGDAFDIARSRLRNCDVARSPTDKQFSEFHKNLESLVDGGPNDTPMAQRHKTDIRDLAGSDARMRKQFPLDLVLLACLDPSFAQIAGLQWVDKSTIDGDCYDYMIVADHVNTFGVNDGDKPDVAAQKVLVWITNAPFPLPENVDVYVAFNLRLEPAETLAKPQDLKVYWLPGKGSEYIPEKEGEKRILPNGVGLKWDLGKAQDVLMPGKPVFYHLWRADCGTDEPSPNQPPGLSHYNCLTDVSARPILVIEKYVTEPLSLLIKPHISNWNQSELSSPFPMHAIDRPTLDGWYSYRVSGIDLFGRHTDLSNPGPWYAPGGREQIHPYAVKVIDETPPPIPNEVRAQILDPMDPLWERDKAYQDWMATQPEAEQGKLVCCRVRWCWTSRQSDQGAIDPEFRILYHPGRLNEHRGDIQKVSSVNAQTSQVEVNLFDIVGDHVLIGSQLRVKQRSFEIIGDEPLDSEGHHRRLLVNNHGADKGIAPAEDVSCSIVTPPADVDGNANRHYVDYADSGNWERQLHKVTFDQGRDWYSPKRKSVLLGDNGTVTKRSSAVILDSDVDLSTININTDFLSLANDSSEDGKTYPIRSVNNRSKRVTLDEKPSLQVEPSSWSIVRMLAGSEATVASNTIKLPTDIDLTFVTKVHDFIQLENDTKRENRLYRILHIDEDNNLRVDGKPQLSSSPSPWSITAPRREFDVFLPITDPGSLKLSPSLEETKVFGNIGVSAVISKPASDGGVSSGATANGNTRYLESPVSHPCPVFRVHRVKPDPPEPPPFPLDDTKNIYATAANIEGNSYYTYRWQPRPHLKVYITRALDDSVFKADWAYRTANWPNPPTISPLDKDYFPVELRTDDDQSVVRTREKVAKEINRLNGLLPSSDRDQVKQQYRSLSNRALRVLASFPWTEIAFTQLHSKPLDPQEKDPKDPTLLRWRNRRGPNDPDEFKVWPDTSSADRDPLGSPELRIYVDTLDGRATNCYFYRAQFVDDAHNKSSFSLSSPPVYLPNVVPPRTPVITKIFAGDPDPNAPGDRKITLRWASNREPDLMEYRIYRTDKKENARDTRLMEFRKPPVPVPPEVHPAARPSEVVWTDKNVPGLVNFYYRIVAVNTARNVSVASEPKIARAFDEALPVPPIPAAAWVSSGNGAFHVEVSWSSTDETLLQRRLAILGQWQTLTSWLPPDSPTFVDETADQSKPYDYRLWARKSTGAIAKGSHFRLTTPV